MSMSDSDDGPILPDDTEFETEYPETEQDSHDKWYFEPIEPSHNNWHTKPIEPSKDPEVIKENQKIAQIKTVGNLSVRERTEDHLAWKEHEWFQNRNIVYPQHNNFDPVIQNGLFPRYHAVQNEFCMDRYSRPRRIQDLADELKEQDDLQEQKEEVMDENGLQKIKTILNKFKQHICINGNCAICLDKNVETIQTKCNHYFCYNCLESSLKKCGFFCPVCRSLI